MAAHAPGTNAAPSAPAGASIAGPEPIQDELRDRLLDAAAAVFARKGYEGTKIMDIVREAGLSTGAVYGRFSSKNDLLREAVVRQAPGAARLGEESSARVAEVIVRLAQLSTEPLTDAEAVRLEAYVAARREPEVAAALGEAQQAARRAVQPIVDAAVADGTVDDGIDPESVLFFVRTMQLGLLVQRAAGAPVPGTEAWSTLVGRVVASFGRPAASDHLSASDDAGTGARSDRRYATRSRAPRRRPSRKDTP